MARAKRCDPSRIGGWVEAIVRALDSLGLDGREVAQQANIDHRVVLRTGARSPLSASTALWQLAVHASGDPCFGLRVPRFLAAPSSDALSYAMMASGSLRECFERVVRYQRLVSTAVRLSFEGSGNRYRFVVTPERSGEVCDAAIDAFMAYAAFGCRALHRSRNLNPLGLRLERAEPSPSTPFAKVFRCPIAFRRAHNALDFAAADIERPLPTANAELARRSDEVVVRYLDRLAAYALADQVRAVLVNALPSGELSQREAARRVGVSPRSLQRRLIAEGTSYKQLLDETRLLLARSYVEEGRRSIQEIAYLLGFSEPSAFSRAFKRWTGSSPKLYAAVHE